MNKFVAQNYELADTNCIQSSKSMKFHLNYTPPALNPPISPDSNIIWMGSCFAEHIGTKWKELGLNGHINPYGILYNPIAIAQNLLGTLANRQIKDEELIFSNGLYFHYDFHSRFSHPEKSTSLAKIRQSVSESHIQLKSAKFLCITFGTSYGWQLKATKQLVSNCHKQAQQLFEKKLYSIDEMLQVWKNLLDKLKSYNPNLRIILTVSPVKHLREGITENIRSKARLIELAHTLTEYFDQVVYFPAFELIQEDLRDYRFYKEDLAHPNTIAIRYVWEKFCNWAFSKHDLLLLNELEELNKLRLHKPIHPSHNESSEIQQQIAHKKDELIARFPFLNL